MDSSRFPPEPSAATPLVSALQAKLVRQIDQGAMYDEMYATVVEMGEELSEQNVVKVDDMITALKNDDGNQMTLLLHTIPRPVLRSIVMRMVAYDFWERDSDNRMLLYDREGPGAYIVTLSVLNRRGRAWSVKENKEIIKYLKLYAHAIETYEREGDSYGDSQLVEHDRTSMQVAADIDKVYQKTDSESGGIENKSDSESSGPSWWQEPRFASSSKTNKSRSVRHLIQMLRKRNIANVDENEPAKQSVCMVGNSDDIEKRTQNHRLISALSNTAHCWGLLVSCLKYAGLEPEETIIPVCKAWKVEHINMAEILVTVLAGSLISVGGLNVKQAGTKSEKNPPHARVFESGRIHVWRSKPWFHENLAHSNPSLSKLLEAEQELDEIDMDALEAKVEEVANLNDKLEKQLAELDAIEERLAKEEEEIDKARELSTLLADNPDIMDALSF
ncbi:hypothetical protein F4774DRAFT_425116 [Daldinia eschscholtzii]|nr:hypothetical protein F4774DRAFT_425116 [Daldinia eschscholtzii]